MNLVRKALWIGALSGGLALVSSVNGLASGGPVQVSHPPSPLAACAPRDAGQIGRNYLNGTEEPQLAVNGKNMIAMWHQDRWSSGGAHGIGVGSSADGGKTWSESSMPWSACAPGTPSSLSIYLRNSDPWVSIGPDGTAYASALAFNLGLPNNFNSVAAATSKDGGESWQNVQPIPGSVFTTFSQSTDKNATTADPVHAGVAYTVWDTLFEPTDNPDDNPHTSAYTGPAFFSKTTDGGVTWSHAQVIINTGNRKQTIGNIIVVDPRSGTLYDFTDLFDSPNTSLGQGTNTNAQIAFVKSTDGGNSWTQPQVISPFNSLGVIDPMTGQTLRVGNGLAEVAIDPANGKLYLVYESSSKFNKNTKQSSVSWDDEILLISSSDGGATWSSPTSVDHNNNGMPAYTPTVAVNNGIVAVTYYDNRNLGTNAAVMGTDYWVSFSTDGGASFGGERRITAASFDQLSAPNARGFFLGDYEALQPSGSGFEAVFVKTNCNAPYTGALCGPASSSTASTPNTDPTDVFAASL